MALFYKNVLNLHVIEIDVIENDGTCQVLANDTMELVIHGVPESIAKDILIKSPPELRTMSAVKPVYCVASIEQARKQCEASQGGMKSSSEVWEQRGASIVDAWDPEGNIIQLKAPR